MCFGVGAVRHVRLVVGVLRKFIENALEHAQLVPPAESRVDRLPRAESLRQVAPLHPRLGDVENRVHEEAIRQLAWTAAPPSLAWQHLLDSAPLRFAHLMSAHRKLRSNFRSQRKQFRLELADFEDRP